MQLQRSDALSRVAVIWPKNMLHDARMAGLAKLRRSIRSTDERQLRAVHVGRGEIVWQDRCDAANGSKGVGFSDATRGVWVARSVAWRRRSAQAGNRGVGLGGTAVSMGI